MKLLITPTSPFARKARILIAEKGLTCETAAANPWENDPQVLAANALRKIPILRTDDGAALIDSPVICEYLDSLSDSPRFLPADPAARAAVKTREALADGATEAIAAVVMAKRVDPELKSPAWEKWLLDKARKAFAQFAQKFPPLGDEWRDLGEVALFCALDFAAFRRPGLDWQTRHPELAAWYNRVAERPAARQTNPRE